MGLVSIAVTATTSVDGVTHGANGTLTLNARRVSQGSRDLSNSFQQVAQGFAGALICINNGDESAYIQFQSTGARYIVFEVVAGGHIVIPSGLFGNAVEFTMSAVNARSATSAGTRITLIIVE